jgi:polyphosphate kinase 2 (PPK2 family)
LSELSEQLGVLQMDLSLSNRSMIVCFEGWDASGKGSCIKHLCHALNPRGYAVFQTKAPSKEELDHTYLWRFVGGIPKKGHITVFDRTWYGRMMVEHIEGFCTDLEYGRSPIEINALEKMIVNDGAILLKFWLDISRDEQKKRFKKRTKDPLKQWKITEEDWRNRAKWKEYDEHVDVMMESTNTEYAPWVVVDANNKKHARVVVLRTVIETFKKELNK